MRMCQNEPNPESQIKDFRGFSSFRELGNVANGIFYSSQYETSAKPTTLSILTHTLLEE